MLGISVIMRNIYYDAAIKEIVPYNEISFSNRCW